MPGPSSSMARRNSDQVADHAPQRRRPRQHDGGDASIARVLHRDRLALLREVVGQRLHQRARVDALARFAGVLVAHHAEHAADQLVHLAHVGDAAPHLLVSAFHPELSDDLRIHRIFLR